MEANEEYFKQHGEPLFSSHMLDLSEEPLEEVLYVCKFVCIYIYIQWRRQVMRVCVCVFVCVHVCMYFLPHARSFWGAAREGILRVWIYVCM